MIGTSFCLAIFFTMPPNITIVVWEHSQPTVLIFVIRLGVNDWQQFLFGHFSYDATKYYHSCLGAFPTNCVNICN